MNLCSKPGCGHAGAVILGYDYSQRRIMLEDPEGGEISPHAYAMCTSCAEKLKPPRGWEVEDHRSEPPLFLDDVTRLELVEATRLDEPDDLLAPEPVGHQLFFGTSA